MIHLLITFFNFALGCRNPKFHTLSEHCAMNEYRLLILYMSITTGILHAHFYSSTIAFMTHCSTIGLLLSIYDYPRVHQLSLVFFFTGVLLVAPILNGCLLVTLYLIFLNLLHTNYIGLCYYTEMLLVCLSIYHLL